jgi:putative endonuclease
MLGCWVYIMASRRDGTLYLGVTSDLVRRVAEHRAGVMPGFREKYGVKRLVWYGRTTRSRPQSGARSG